MLALAWFLSKLSRRFKSWWNPGPDRLMPAEWTEAIKADVAKPSVIESLSDALQEDREDRVLIKHREYRGSLEDYQMHLSRHRKGEHDHRRYDDCELCERAAVTGLMTNIGVAYSKTYDQMLKDYEDDRDSINLGRFYRDEPFVEPNVPEGSTYAEPKPLPTLRSSLCVEGCHNKAGGAIELCSGVCVQLVTETATKPVDEAKELLEQAFPEVEKKIAYPAPDASVTEWVDWRIGAGAYTPDSLNRSADGKGPLAGFSLSVRRGFSMAYLTDIVARAKRKDMTLTLDQLAAARSRGLI